MCHSPVALSFETTDHPLSVLTVMYWDVFFSGRVNSTIFPVLILMA